TALKFGFVIVSTGALITIDISRGTQVWGELFEVPLMSAMFMAMVWHARRRQDALGIAEKHAEQLESTLEREEQFLHDASHELRTPVTIARGHLEVLGRTNGRRAPEVADEGLGVPDEAHSRIFQRFARADAARTRSAGGVGLGLAIVDTIVKAHGGRCQVSRSTRGSVFGIQLPGFMVASPTAQSAIAH